MDLDEVVPSLLLYAAGLFVLYWVIRKAVAGGIWDADQRRAATRDQ